MPKRITRSVTAFKNMTRPAAMLSCPVCRANIDGLTPYRRYVFQVAAVTTAGIGPFSAPKNLTTAQAGILSVFYLQC